MMFAIRTVLLNNVGAEGGRQNPTVWCTMRQNQPRLGATFSAHSAHSAQLCDT